LTLQSRIRIIEEESLGGLRGYQWLCTQLHRYLHQELHASDIYQPLFWTDPSLPFSVPDLGVEVLTIRRKKIENLEVGHLDQIEVLSEKG